MKKFKLVSYYGLLIVISITSQTLAIDEEEPDSSAVLSETRGRGAHSAPRIGIIQVRTI